MNNKKECLLGKDHSWIYYKTLTDSDSGRKGNVYICTSCKALNIGLPILSIWPYQMVGSSKSPGRFDPYTSQEPHPERSRTEDLPGVRVYMP